MTDNFKLIKDFIQSQWGGQFDSFTDTFYMVEMIGRAKDNARIIAGRPTPRSNATMRRKATLFVVPLFLALCAPYAHANDWPLPSSYDSYIERAQPVLNKIRAILDEEGVPHFFIFLALAESGGDPLNVSPKGAAGLWQLMPSTARTYGITPGDRLDVEKSTRAAAKYIRHLLDEFDNDYLWTVAAYNTGGHNLKRATGYRNGMDFEIVRNKRPAAYALARTVQRMEAEYGKRQTGDNSR